MSIQAQAIAIADTDSGIVLASVEIPSSVDQVFNAFSDKSEIERWWGSDDLYWMTNWRADFREGGHYTVEVVGAKGVCRPASGEFLVIQSPHKLSYTRKYEWDFPVLGRRETIITYNFSKAATGTKVNVRHENFGDCREAALEHADGWVRVLTWLCNYLKRHKQKQQ